MSKFIREHSGTTAYNVEMDRWSCSAYVVNSPFESHQQKYSKVRDIVCLNFQQMYFML